MAAFTISPNCWAIVRDVSLLIMSPATMPLTPPVGFRSAVRRPRRRACTTASGAEPCANCSATPNIKCLSRGLSNKGRKCSTVIPDGLGAAPFLADLTFFAKTSSSRLKRDSGTWEKSAPRQRVPRLLSPFLTTRKRIRPLVCSASGAVLSRTSAPAALAHAAGSGALHAR